MLTIFEILEKSTITFDESHQLIRIVLPSDLNQYFASSSEIYVQIIKGQIKNVFKYFGFDINLNHNQFTEGNRIFDALVLHHINSQLAQVLLYLLQLPFVNVINSSLLADMQRARLVANVERPISTNAESHQLCDKYPSHTHDESAASANVQGPILPPALVNELFEQCLEQMYNGSPSSTSYIDRASNTQDEEYDIDEAFKSTLIVSIPPVVNNAEASRLHQVPGTLFNKNGCYKDWTNEKHPIQKFNSHKITVKHILAALQESDKYQFFGHLLESKLIADLGIDKRQYVNRQTIGIITRSMCFISGLYITEDFRTAIHKNAFALTYEIALESLFTRPEISYVLLKSYLSTHGIDEFMTRLSNNLYLTLDSPYVHFITDTIPRSLKIDKLVEMFLKYGKVDNHRFVANCLGNQRCDNKETQMISDAVDIWQNSFKHPFGS